MSKEQSKRLYAYMLVWMLLTLRCGLNLGRYVHRNAFLYPSMQLLVLLGHLSVLLVVAWNAIYMIVLTVYWPYQPWYTYSGTKGKNLADFGIVMP